MTDDQPPSAVTAPGHEVMSHTKLSADVHRLVVTAPRVAAVRQPGQFVIVRLGPGAERIPLTIADSDSERGSIVLVVQAVGKSTSDLVALAPGDQIHDVVGPLGRPSDLVAEGTAVCVAGGVGAAVMFPIARRLAELGVDVITVLGPVAALLPQVSDLARGSLMLRMLRVGRAVAFGRKKARSPFERQTIGDTSALTAMETAPAPRSSGTSEL